MYDWVDGTLTRGHDLEDKSLLSTLDNALSKCPNYRGIVYRADYLDSYRNIKVGSVISILGGSTKSTEVADRWIRIRSIVGPSVQFVLSITKGADISKYNPSQQEVVLLSGSKFRLTHIESIEVQLKRRLANSVRVHAVQVN